MTKKEFTKIVVNGWNGVSPMTVATGEDFFTVELKGTKHCATGLYQPRHKHATIRQSHNLRVRAMRKFERWLKDVCTTNGIPWQTYEQYSGHTLEFIEE